MQVLGIQ